MAKEKYRRVVCDTRMEHLNKDVEINIPDATPEIDENQALINKLLGVGDDVFFKYSRGLHGDDPAKHEQAQAVMDTFHKAGDQVFCKYQNNPEKWPGVIDECQRRINELMGISDEMHLKYCKDKTKPDPSIDEGQRKINEMMGIDDATYKKYHKEGR